MDKDSYMNELRKNLNRLSMEQQEDILRELGQNIADGIAFGCWCNWVNCRGDYEDVWQYSY